MIFRILVLIQIAWMTSALNPGLLVQIPTSLSPPSILIQFPQPIPSIVINNLELTNINLRDIEYKWKVTGSKFAIQIPSTLISFDWTMGKDHGEGTFQQTFQILDITFKFGKDSNQRLQIQILQSVITVDQGKSKISIHLGGGAKETIITQVTNLITNHAKFAFRQAISKVLQSAVKSLSSPLEHDIQIGCIESKCIKIDTTLVSQPLLKNNVTLVPIKGGPYLTGQARKQFNPSDVMFIQDSTQLSMQVHQDVINRVIQLYQKEEYASFEIRSTQISSIAQITSQTLSMVFPNMQYFPKPKDVIFHLDLNNITTFNTQNQCINVQVALEGSIKTDQIGDHSIPDAYINSFTGNLMAKLGVVYRENKVTFKVNDLIPQAIDFSDEDISARRVEPSALDKYIVALISWLGGAFNGYNSWKLEMLYQAKDTIEECMGIN